MYKVIKTFSDLKDKLHRYNEGDVYPREGYTPSESRIAELAGSTNRLGQPLIECDEEKPKAKRSKGK